MVCSGPEHQSPPYPRTLYIISTISPNTAQRCEHECSEHPPTSLTEGDPVHQLDFYMMMRFEFIVASLFLYVVRSAQALHYKTSDRNQVNKWVLNQPLSFQSPHMKGIIDARNDSSIMAQTEAVISLYRANHERGGNGGADNEIVDVIGAFFKIASHHSLHLIAVNVL